jgi:4-carboxymuconolactone decarboxylase
MPNPRIAPIEPPYEDDVQQTLTKLMPPGMEPLKIFRTLVHNRDKADRMRVLASGLLNKGSLEPNHREIVLHRTCARCGCEYEWGVHAAFFAQQLGWSDAKTAATVIGDADDPAWTEEEAILIRFADELHDTATLSDALWKELASRWTSEQIIELFMVAGMYHLISYVCNGLRIELEEFAPRFPDHT